MPDDTEQDIDHAEVEDLDDEGAEHADEDPETDEGEGDEAGESEELSDDPAADEGEGAEGTARDVDRPRKRGASEVIREQKRRARQAEEEREQLRRERDELRRRAEDAERRAQERRASETAEEERQRLELMTEGERLAYQTDKLRKEYDGKLQGVQLQVWDGQDQARFDRLCDRQPIFEKVRSKVEAEFERMKREGRATQREVIAKYMLGEMMVANAGRAKSKQARRAADDTRRETARAPRGRSDVQQPRARRGNEDTPEARRKRLEGVVI